VSAPRYTGNVPRNVSRDAKYSVVRGDKGWGVRLVFQLNSREKALLTTKKHPRLIAMVNEIKEDVAGSEGGVFYINEYSDVLVPAGGEYYVAGKYEELLEFDFEGRIISPKAARTLAPGDLWPGPSVGVRYKITADLADIAYESNPRPNVTREVRLSDSAGVTAARKLAKRLADSKGGSGRIYINEAREFFSPSATHDSSGAIYLGHLGDDDWFPSPR
jgi:hypothetical protein